MTNSYDSNFEIRLATLGVLGGDTDRDKYDSVYEVDLAILELLQGGGLDSKAIETVDTLPTASADLVGKMYRLSTDNKVYTISLAGSNYAWTILSQGEVEIPIVETEISIGYNSTDTKINFSGYTGQDIINLYNNNITPIFRLPIKTYASGVIIKPYNIVYSSMFTILYYIGTSGNLVVYTSFRSNSNSTYLQFFGLNNTGDIDDYCIFNTDSDTTIKSHGTDYGNTTTNSQSKYDLHPTTKYLVTGTGSSPISVLIPKEFPKANIEGRGSDFIGAELTFICPTIVSNGTYTPRITAFTNNRNNRTVEVVQNYDVNSPVEYYKILVLCSYVKISVFYIPIKYVSSEIINNSFVGSKNLAINSVLYTEEHKWSGTSTQDDEMYLLDIYAELEADKEYVFSACSDANWGGVAGDDTVEWYLLKEGGYSYYISSASLTKRVLDNGNSYWVFTPTQSGWYSLRFDINKANQTHYLWNISINEGRVVSSSHAPNVGFKGSATYSTDSATTKTIDFDYNSETYVYKQTSASGHELNIQLPQTNFYQFGDYELIIKNFCYNTSTSEYAPLTVNLPGDSGVDYVTDGAISVIGNSTFTINPLKTTVVKISVRPFLNQSGELKPEYVIYYTV